ATPVSLNTQDWNCPTYGTHTSAGTDSGGDYVKVNTDKSGYSTQILQSLIFEKPVARVVFTGKMKTESVMPGLNAIDCARAQAVFLSEHGEKVGEWPKATDVAVIQPWTPFRQELTAPTNAKGIRLMLGFYLSTGTACYRELDIQAFDQTGAPVDWKLAGPEKTDTTGWWPWSFPDEDTTRPLVYDFSPWLRKEGDSRFLEIKGDKFVWSDGTEVRFWGTNIGTDAKNNILTSTHEEIDAIVAFYARSGCNLIRLHQMDSGIFSPPAGLFVQNADNTSSFDADRLDRFDYIVASAKRAGISILFDLLDTRKFRSGDGVMDYEKLDYGAKIAGLFNPRLIELQKDYARKILSHVNPYTKLALKDDPILVMLNIINESTLLSVDGYAHVPESYKRELGVLFDKWCKAQTPPMTRPPGEIAQLLSQGNATVIRFLDETQATYYRDMSSMLRDELKVKVPMLGSNHWENHVGDVTVNARLGFLDRHAYWDHPQGGWSERDGFHNRPMVGAMLQKDSILQSIATQRVAHHPFTVTEWNACWPNEYIAEAPVLMSAYGSLQNWNGLLNFTLNLYQADRNGRMSGAFSNGNRPHFMASFTSSALIYLRGDISPGAPFYSPIDAAHPLNPAGTDIVPARVLTNQVGSVLPDEGGDALKAPNEVASRPEVVQSEGGQLEWRASGLVRINTSKTQGCVGFTGGKPVALTDCTIQITNSFATVLLISLDGLPLPQSRHLLVQATARAENTGQIYRPFRKGLISSGTTPVLVEPVRASIVLRRRAQAGTASGPTSTLKPQQFAVDRYGRRGQAVSIAKQTSEGLKIDLGSDPGLAFEVILP
ncbi:MAG TPA: hypothetical protein VK970_09120, partial [Candidatus Methylacidiphilales bacterium]|nr:hypothetical protein [Candidatus Methylacidiphilales bacterium]